MQKIPLNLAEPGMKLARAVARDNGTTIVGEGVELTAGLIARLEGMDVERIVVQGSPVDLEGAAGGTSYDERLARLDHLFRSWKQDPWMRKVRAFLTHYFTVKAAARAASVQEAEHASGRDGAEQAAGRTAHDKGAA